MNTAHGDDSAYDVIVIGSGGAAMAAGIEARRRGLTVLLVEESVVGGTCVNRGCIPSKYLLAAASQRHLASQDRFAGIQTAAGTVDLPALIATKNTLVEQMRSTKYVDVAAAHGFQIRHGHASFTDERTLCVDGEQLIAGCYVIATGSRPAIPDLPGISDVETLTSTTVMELTHLPASMVVIGAGYVGLEQAQLWSRLGVPVTVVGRFAPHTDPELSVILKAAFIDEGITVVEARAVAVEQTEDAAHVVTADGQRVSGHRLLAATGREPNTPGLQLERAGVSTNDGGFIVVDDQQRTSNPRIFAAGDVSAAPQYVYVAARTGHVAAAGASQEQQTVDYTALPAVTFTSPQLLTVGLTEQQVLDSGRACECRTLDAADIPRAVVNGDTRGAVKMVIDADTRQLLGVHAVLEGAGELALAATYAITGGMTIQDVHESWAPYLTMTEALRLTAGLFLSDLPTSCCA